MALATKVKVKVTPTPFTGIIANAKARLAGLSPQANAAAAAKQAAAALAPQIASENASSAAAQRQFTEQYTRSSEFAKAMAAIRGESGQQATAPYLDATGTLGYLGSGVGGAVAAAQQAVHDKAAQQVSAMTGGLGEVGGFDIPSLTSVGQYADVTVPGRSLAAEAMSAAAAARNRTDVTADQLGVLANNFNQQAVDALAEHAANLRTIQSQRAGLTQSARQALDDRASQAENLIATLTGNEASYKLNQRQLLQAAKAAAEGRRQFGITSGETKREFGITSKEAARHNLVAEQNAADQLEITRDYLGQAGRKTDLAIRQGVANLTGRDPKTGNLLPGYMLDPKSGSIVAAKDYYAAQLKREKANATAKTGGLTPNEYAGLKKSVKDQATQMQRGVADAQRWNPTTKKFEWDPTKPGTRPTSYENALRQLASQGPPTLDWANYVVNLLDSIYPASLRSGAGTGVSPTGVADRPVNRAEAGQLRRTSVEAALAIASAARTASGFFGGM